MNVGRDALERWRDEYDKEWRALSLRGLMYLRECIDDAVEKYLQEHDAARNAEMAAKQPTIPD